MSTGAGDPPPERPPDEPSPPRRPWDDIEVPELDEVASRRPAAPAGAGPPRRRRRGRWLPVLVALLVLAAIGFLVWYFLFRGEGGEAGSSGAPISVEPASVDFGDEDVGRRSPLQTVTLTNTGARPLGIESIELTGKNRKSFAVAAATTCDPIAPLNADESCTIAIRFRPTGRGDRTATLAVRISGQNDLLGVGLSGVGIGEPEVALETTRIDLGEVRIGGEPATGRVRLANRGNVALRIESIELEGQAAADFEALRGRRRCSPSRAVRPGGACALAVRFSPTEVGEWTATLVVRHDAPAGLAQIQQHGVGVRVPRGRVSPSEIAFGRVRVSRRSAPETVTFENIGSGVVAISAVAIGGDGARNFRIAQATCETGTRLRPGETCMVDVRFRPQTRGAHASTLVIEANTPAGRHAVELRGRGAPAAG